MQSKTISIYLPEHLIEQIDKIGDVKDRPRSYIIQQAIKEYLEKNGVLDREE